MFKRIFMISLIAITILSLSSLSPLQAKTKPKIGVILSGCGMMDGTEIYEAAFTVLALENSDAEIIFMAPDIYQASVVNHLKNDEKVTEQRNVLVESSRIARGNIKDIKNVSANDIDALIIPGGMGTITTLSDIISNGVNGKVEPDVQRLIKETYDAKKPIGSMCAASMIIAKVLGNQKVNITIGKNNDFFGPMITAFGAIHSESTGDSIIVDKSNKIVTTPAVMSGASNAVIYIGITKMVKKVLQMIKK